MPVTIVKTANFGKLRGGLATVGYTLYDEFGLEAEPRSDVNVSEVGPSTGIYSAPVNFPESFMGSILWDTGQGAQTVYASEEVNISNATVSIANDVTSIKSAIDADLTFIKDMIGGRWVIDAETYQMIFYKGDNSTEVARFDLRDKNGNPSYLSVFNRHRL